MCFLCETKIDLLSMFLLLRFFKVGLNMKCISRWFPNFVINCRLSVRSLTLYMYSTHTLYSVSHSCTILSAIVHSQFKPCAHLCTTSFLERTKDLFTRDPNRKTIYKLFQQWPRSFATACFSFGTSTWADFSFTFPFN